MSKKTQHLIDAALDLAAEQGWQAVTLADVALRAKQPLSEVYAHFRSRTDILRAFLDRVDEHMMSGEVDEDASPRDRLFEAAMRRFEVLNRHKGAVRAMLTRGAGVGPVTALCGARRFARSMALMLEAAGIGSTGILGLVRINGATAVYLYAMRAWLCDDTPDMARTMAALDTALARAEAMADTFRRGNRPPTPPSEEAQPD
jgi:AcrR family transcriptional regulator